MSNYTKSTNFATKDALPSGDPLKIVKGTEIDTEFNNIATAVLTKADLASPTFTGNVTGTFVGNVTGNVAGNVTGTASTLATGRTIALTGDVSYTSPAFDGSANVTAAATLANTAVTAGTYGSTSAIPVITVDAKGRVTSASTTSSGVTSVATGNGLSGGTITTTGTLAVAAPGFNTVGSYCFIGIQATTGAIASGATLSAGAGADQVQSYVIGGGVTNNLSGTWRYMTGTIGGASCNVFAGIACRIS